MTATPTILCLASYFKGSLFMEECQRQGCHVILITEQKLSEEAWPRTAINEFYLMPDLAQQPDITHAVSFLARTRAIDCIVALDDYDVETAAALREHLRLPGLGISAAKLFRDKLAMRVAARQANIRVPEFIHVLHHERLADFMARVPAPWVLKPRGEAGSMGIKKVHHASEVWAQVESLGDRQSFFLLEQFLAGNVYHVDSIVWDSEIVFAVAHRYGLPPMTVYQGGGVFATSTLPYGGEEEQGHPARGLHPPDDLSSRQADDQALARKQAAQRGRGARRRLSGQRRFRSCGARRNAHGCRPARARLGH